MQRMQNRGQEIVVSLFMENARYPDTQSRNLLIDLVGSEKPEEYGEILTVELFLFSIHSLIYILQFC